MAICVAGEEKILLKVKSLKSRKKYKNIKNINEPMQLNKRWITAALFPLVEEPILEIKAVTQEPILVPRITKNTPFPVPPTTTPANAKAIKIEVTAEDDWKIAVTAIPINKSKKGLSIEDNKSLI